MWKCKHCHKFFEELSTSQKANHSRWCTENPKHAIYVMQMEKMRKHKRTGMSSNQFILARELGLPIPAHSMKGKKIKGHLHTEETKQVLRKKALASKHRRLVRSVRPYTKKSGEIVMLDSSWEEMLAHRLDELDVEWVRPEPIKWLDSVGNQRNYFPDFYLPVFDLYLDPKNPAAMKQQLEKVQWLRQNVSNVIFLEDTESIARFSPDRW